MAHPDWLLIRSFRIVAIEGSLSAAARRLGLTQPTVGRHIQQLEALINEPLFTRHSRGLSLTRAGVALLEPADEMAAAAHRFAQAADGQSDALAGTVRITTSEVLAHYHMPEIIRNIRQTAPKVEIELNATDSSENLLFGEADIAVRMFRPEQVDLITRHVGDISLGIYASKSYLANFGDPERFPDTAGHTFIGYDRSDLILKGMKALGLSASRDDFSIRCDSQTAYWQLVASGCGIGIGQCSVAAQFPDIVRILQSFAIPPLPVWLATSRQIHNSARLRHVSDHLFNSLKRIVEAFPATG